jgi:hypothetical protein
MRKEPDCDYDKRSISVVIGGACGSYHDFLDRVLLKTRKLLNHGPWWLSLSHQSDLVKRYGLSVSPMTTDMLRIVDSVSQHENLN